MSENISAQTVMELRRRTGVGMGKCKEALQEAEGDMENAILILRKKGMASAVKKGGRETNEGVIGHVENDRVAYFIEVNFETDFVIQNERFKEFMKNICAETLESLPKSVEEFLQKKYTKNPELTVDEYRSEIVHSLGENIQIKRILAFEKSDDRSLGIYSHMGGKIVAAAILEGASDQVELARQVAMHVAAHAPEFLQSKDISSEIREREEEIIRGQVGNKPPEIMDKIVQGKMRAFYEQSCLADQKYVKEPSMSVADFVARGREKSGQRV